MVDLNGLTTLIYVDWIPQVNGPPEKSVRSDNWNQDFRCKAVRKVESTITYIGNKVGLCLTSLSLILPQSFPPA